MIGHIQKTALITFFLQTCFFSEAQAGLITFDDNTIHFPSYGVSSSFAKDEYGTPKIQSLTVNWNDTTGILNSVSINLKQQGIQRFDNLFINTDYGDGDTDLEGWDYLVHSVGRGNDKKSSGPSPGNGLWKVDDDYVYTTNLYGGREGHATGIDTNYLSGIVDKKGRQKTLSGITGRYDKKELTIFYDFSSFDINIGNTFAIAYSPWCANDVILISHAFDPVPEPRTMLLFGAGLMCLVGGTVIRKHKRR